ncbi:hypothetical protein ACFX11_032702 [Malus domestica]
MAEQVEPGGQAKGKSSRIDGESVSSPIEFGANGVDSSRSGKRSRGIDGPNLDAERDMAALHLEPNVSFKDKLMKSSRRLVSVAVSDFDFDPDLVDGDVSFSREAEAKMAIKRRYAAY